jgi:uncharacterized protein YggE
MRTTSPLFVLLLTPVALGQTPAADKGTVTAEAVELVRAKPDLAKLYFTVINKNGDATIATDENAEQTKVFAEAIHKLDLAGVKVASQALRVNRVETQNRMGGGNNIPFIPEFHAVRTVLVSVSSKDADKLRANLERVQQEAAKQGVSGETGNASYNGMSYERNAPVRLVYTRQDGWDDDTVAALGKATKRAIQRAEAMATGAGLKVGEVLSIGEPTTAGPQTVYNYAGTYTTTAQSGDPQDEFIDGELVRKVRVRVVVAVGK